MRGTYDGRPLTNGGAKRCPPAASLAHPLLGRAKEHHGRNGPRRHQPCELIHEYELVGRVTESHFSGTTPNEERF